MRFKDLETVIPKFPVQIIQAVAIRRRPDIVVGEYNAVGDAEGTVEHIKVFDSLGRVEVGAYGVAA